jgi:ATP-dependent RNA helicase RhlE
LTTFRQLGLTEPILRGVLDAGYEEPTPIQAQAIPLAVKGTDLIGCAQTGTGKTAAFVLPTLDWLVSEPLPKGTRKRPIRALIVTPTRELAIQIDDSIRTYGKHTDLRSASVLGGVGFGPQLKALKNGIDLLVATPGRLLDHMQRGSVKLDQVDILILDEADRMLDMGFIRDIRTIVAAVPEQRQTLLFSATMPNEIRDLAQEVLYKPQEVRIGEVRSTADTVRQRALPVDGKQKLDLLVRILKDEPVDGMLVFSRTKRRADRIAKQLAKKGFETAAMHGNRSQNQRQRALNGFKDGKVQVLVATDVAARGIDVDRVSHVVNYDTPQEPESYIHRIGRTGRAQTTGEAMTFVSPEEAEYLTKIERHTGALLDRHVYDGFDAPHIAEVTPPSKKKKGGGGGGGNRNGRNKNRNRSRSKR